MASGRKREFDENTALHAAMDVFWTKGYMGASLSELTKSMQINKPSMYSAFGNKEALFLKATQLYIDNKAQSHAKMLFESGVPFKQRLRNFMASIVAVQCESNQPKGCYLVLCQAEIAGGDLPESATQLLKQACSATQKLLVELFDNDADAISLGLNNHSVGNALSLVTVLNGTASMARAGVPLFELEYVIDNSLRGIGVH